MNQNKKKHNWIVTTFAPLAIYTGIHYNKSPLPLKLKNRNIKRNGKNYNIKPKSRKLEYLIPAIFNESTKPGKNINNGYIIKNNHLDLLVKKNYISQEQLEELKKDKIDVGIIGEIDKNPSLFFLNKSYQHLPQKARSPEKEERLKLYVTLNPPNTFIRKISKKPRMINIMNTDNYIILLLVILVLINIRFKNINKIILIGVLILGIFIGSILMNVNNNNNNNMVTNIASQEQFDMAIPDP